LALCPSLPAPEGYLLLIVRRNEAIHTPYNQLQGKKKEQVDDMAGALEHKEEGLGTTYYPNFDVLPKCRAKGPQLAAQELLGLVPRSIVPDCTLLPG